MVKQNEVIDWHKYFTYKDGKLFHKYRDFGHKSFNTKYAGKEAGSLLPKGYIGITFGGRTHYLHRIIWEIHNGKIPNDLEVDHINENTSDNRIENLQLVTSKQNTQRSSHTQAKGYRVSKTNVTKPYQSCRTNKLFGTPCGAYMSYMTAFVQGENYGNSR